MADLTICSIQQVTIIAIYLYVFKLSVMLTMMSYIEHTRPRARRVSWSMYDRYVKRSINVRMLIYESDELCKENIRMDRRAFHNLCHLLQMRGNLQETKNTCIEEMVAMFLHICAHSEKNRCMKRQFVRSKETISRQFGQVLNSILRLHDILLKKPEAVPENSTDHTWKWFKNCLGALDGTYIQVHALEADKPRYKTRKGGIATNVLGVCSQDMQFIYILPGWEGSVADSRVLRDAISRKNGLVVPKGYYYLCDAGYMNGEGFLTPYRGQRYHLNDWRQSRQAKTAQEFYNYKHSSARNVIERCFGLLKGRWAILRGDSHYPVKTQCRIISACALLHNFCMREMVFDEDVEDDMDYQELEGDRITHVEPSDAWTQWRENLAQEMWKNRKHIVGCDG